MLVSATLALLVLSLAWALLKRAGVWPSDWEASLVLIGLSSLVYAFTLKPERPRVPPLALSPFLVPAYFALTLIPLPASILSFLSPARAHLLRNLQMALPSVHAAPLTVYPPATFLGLFSVLAWIATFLLIFGITARLKDRPWITTYPLLILAGFEATLGLIQAFTHSSPVAIGTYTNRDHFSGFLEMVFPFAALYGVALFKHTHRIQTGTRTGLAACLAGSLAVLLFLAIAYSLSRMGFIVVLTETLLVAAALADRRKFARWQWTAAAAAAAALIAGCLFLAPDQLAARFSAITTHEKVNGELRWSLWKDTLPLIAEYPAFGCGYGGYEAVFMKHQTAANEYSVEFAHDDYLQFLAELGLIGFATLAGTFGLIGWQIAQGMRFARDSSRRLLLWACVASLCGMLLHSTADFNLYIPANAMTFAWIAGIALATATEPALSRRSKPSR